jgi:hypothetical protein
VILYICLFSLSPSSTERRYREGDEEKNEKEEKRAREREAGQSE